MGIFSFLRRLFSSTKTIPVKPRCTHIMGRREAVLKHLLAHKYLDCYTLAFRTGLDPQIVSKTLATAIRDNEPIERIKKNVPVSERFGRKLQSRSVWCYRRKPQIIIEQEIHMEHDLLTGTSTSMVL